jgi:hypothetical protein
LNKPGTLAHSAAGGKGQLVWEALPDAARRGNPRLLVHRHVRCRWRAPFVAIEHVAQHRTAGGQVPMSGTRCPTSRVATPPRSRRQGPKEPCPTRRALQTRKVRGTRPRSASESHNGTAYGRPNVFAWRPHTCSWSGPDPRGSCRTVGARRSAGADRRRARRGLTSRIAPWSRARVAPGHVRVY